MNSTATALPSALAGPAIGGAVAVRPAVPELAVGRAVSAAARPRPSAAWLAAALFVESAVGLVVAVALGSVAGSMAEADAVGIRLVAGVSLVVAITAWALGRRGVVRGRAGSYGASALLQVAALVGIGAVAFISGQALAIAVLTPAPLLVLVALNMRGVREALGQP